MKQGEFNFGDIELMNLKRKLSSFDPVTQAEKVVEQLQAGNTQEQLGSKLGKSRDWIAKRVQFIKCLHKLPQAERKEARQLVAQRKISMDVIILVVDLPKKQRLFILSKHPMVAEARQIVDEFRQKIDPKAKLKVLENALSPTYLALEQTFASTIQWGIGTLRAYGPKSLSYEMMTQLNKLYDKLWFENYRFGANTQDSSEWGLADEEIPIRIDWLQMPEKERIAQIGNAITECDKLAFDAIGALTDKARKVNELNRTVNDLQIQLLLERMKKKVGVGDFSLNIGNGIPPLNLDVKSEQVAHFYRTLALAFHPDKHPENPEWYSAMMTAINVWHSQVKENM